MNAIETAMNRSAERRETPLIVHPLWVRVTHALNAAAVVVMLLSGWRIYDASPFLGLAIPTSLTLGGWLAGALEWHFAAMWVLAINGLVYLMLGVMSGRLRRRLWPISPGVLWRECRAALAGRLDHADLTRYGEIQRLAYVVAIVLLVLLVVSGLVLWKSVQFSWLTDLLGGYEAARREHFAAMAALAGFLVVHIVMALGVPRTLLAMIRGY